MSQQIDLEHFLWAAGISPKEARDMAPRDFEEYQQAAKIILSLVAEVQRLKKGTDTPPAAKTSPAAKAYPGPVEDEVIVSALEDALRRAPSCQGGHSSEGRQLATLLCMPFPLSMPALTKRAIELGFDPDKLWPWQAK